MTSIKSRLFLRSLAFLASAVLSSGLFSGAVSGLFHLWAHAQLRESSYNSVFLSMYPIDTYQEADFSHFRGDEIIKITLKMHDYASIRHHLADVKASGNQMRIIYLGVDPEKISADQIKELMAMFPETQFEILPAYLPIEQWAGLEDPSSTLAAYRSLTEGLMESENVRVFSFFAQDWIICDPASYAKDTLLTENIAHLVYIYTDELHGADIQPELIDPIFSHLEELIASEKAGQNTYPNLSDWDIVFFGDSVFGNFTDYHAITELTAHFSGARTYNCGQGGSTASTKTLDLPDLNQVVDAYLNKDLSTLQQGSQVYKGLSARLEDEKASSGRNLLFVIQYGINDYIQAHPVALEDPMNPDGFAGALRTAVEKIKSERPDARILLIVPNSIIYLDGGANPTSFTGGSFQEYLRVVRDVADEYDLLLLDDSVIIPMQGIRGLLVDEIHPNENGRFLITKALLNCLSSSLIEH